MTNDVTVRVEKDASIDGIEVVIKAEERSALVEDIVFAVERCARDRHPRITVYQGNYYYLLSIGLAKKFIWVFHNILEQNLKERFGQSPVIFGEVKGPALYPVEGLRAAGC